MKQWIIDYHTWWTNFWFDHPVIFVIVAALALAVTVASWRFR